MNSLIPGADILEDFHFIPDSKSTTLVYKFGSSTEHSPYDEGLTTMGAGTAIYYFTATGTLGTIYAFAAGDQKAFLKKYNNGTWSNWVALVSNADLEVNTAKIEKCAAKTVTTYYVKFDTPFSSAPIVVATLDLHTENANNSDITITVSNVTNAGFNIRYINNTGSQISNGTVNWIAIRK